MCKSEDVWNVDFAASHELNDNVTLYLNVLNVFDIDAPFDPGAAYSLFNFNPAWAGPNMMGRFFRLGAKLKL
jgi:iron complex outermembrane receptor protein